MGETDSLSSAFALLSGRASGICGRAGATRRLLRVLARTSDCDLGVVDELVEAGRGNESTGIDAGHLGDISIRNADGDGLNFCRVVVDEIHKGTLRVALNGWCGNEGDVAQRVHEEARVDELTGEERIVLVIERGFELYR